MQNSRRCDGREGREEEGEWGAAAEKQGAAGFCRKEVGNAFWSPAPVSFSNICCRIGPFQVAAFLFQEQKREEGEGSGGGRRREKEEGGGRRREEEGGEFTSSRQDISQIACGCASEQKRVSSTVCTTTRRFSCPSRCFCL
eukprot:767987-Hanusia_phi.AAC.4